MIYLLVNSSLTDYTTRWTSTVDKPEDALQPSTSVKIYHCAPEVMPIFMLDMLLPTFTFYVKILHQSRERAQGKFV